MKKLFGYLIGAVFVVAVISSINPKFKTVFKKHIPVMGNEAVALTEDLACTGLTEVEMESESRDTMNRLVHIAGDFVHAGFDFYATEDEAQINRVTQDVNDLLKIGTDGIEKLYNATITSE